MELILGTAVSLLVQWVKKKLGLSMAGVLLVVVLLSLIASAGYSLLAHFGFLAAFKEVLITAGAFYAFIVKNIEDVLK